MRPRLAQWVQAGSRQGPGREAIRWCPSHPIPSHPIPPHPIPSASQAARGDYRHGCRTAPAGSWEGRRRPQHPGVCSCSDREHIRLGLVPGLAGRTAPFLLAAVLLLREMRVSAPRRVRSGTCCSLVRHLSSSSSSSSSSCRARCALPPPAAGYRGAPSPATGCSPRQSRARHPGLGSSSDGGGTPGPQGRASCRQQGRQPAPAPRAATAHPPPRGPGLGLGLGLGKSDGISSRWDYLKVGLSEGGII